MPDDDLQPEQSDQAPPSLAGKGDGGLGQRFRERWPYLPLTWKIAIIALGLITVFEIIRTAINLFQGEYY